MDNQSLGECPACHEMSLYYWSKGKDGRSASYCPICGFRGGQPTEEQFDEAHNKPSEPSPGYPVKIEVFILTHQGPSASGEMDTNEVFCTYLRKAALAGKDLIDALSFLANVGSNYLDSNPEEYKINREMFLGT